MTDAPELSDVSRDLEMAQLAQDLNRTRRLPVSRVRRELTSIFRRPEVVIVTKNRIPFAAMMPFELAERADRLLGVGGTLIPHEDASEAAQDQIESTDQSGN